MGQAVSPSKNASLLSEPLRVQPRKLKKCASHIYISRLIKVLQNSKSSPTTLDQIEQRSSEMSERGLPDPVTTITDFKSMVSPSNRYQNPHLLDLHRTHNPKPVQEDMTQLALELFGPNHTSQKQVKYIHHCSYPVKFLSSLILISFDDRATISYLSHLLEQPNLISHFQTHSHNIPSLHLTIANSHLQLLATKFVALTQIISLLNKVLLVINGFSM